jgi:hypothetical protein
VQEKAVASTTTLCAALSHTVDAQVSFCSGIVPMAELITLFAVIAEQH